jgi:hypothetical protein
MAAPLSVACTDYDDTTKAGLWQSECDGKFGKYNKVAFIAGIRYSIRWVAGNKIHLKRALV